jgi:hypothetical protein
MEGEGVCNFAYYIQTVASRMQARHRTNRVSVRRRINNKRFSNQHLCLRSDLRDIEIELLSRCVYVDPVPAMTSRLENVSTA